MKNLFILILLLPVLIFGQTRTYQYGNWIAASSMTVRLVNTDIDTIFFSYRATSDNVDPDTNTTTYNPPDRVFWSGHGTIKITPTTVSGTETDSLEMWVQGLGPDAGEILSTPKNWLNFSASIAIWQTGASYFDWTSGSNYSCSIGGAFGPIFGIAVFVKQHAGTQVTNCEVEFIRD